MSKTKLIKTKEKKGKIEVVEFKKLLIWFISHRSE
jgi:hypothetical protein